MRRALCLALTLALAGQASAASVEEGVFEISSGDQLQLAFQYGPEYAIPHLWPLRSPSGKDLLVQHPDPYPHHRSCWIADHVKLENGPEVDFYHMWKNYKVPKDASSGFKHSIEVANILPRTDGFHALMRWVADSTTPMLYHDLIVTRKPVGAQGDYCVDLSWTLTAPSSGEVQFMSDWVHYGWPFLRMHPQFSGEQGGTITSDTGAIGQEGTNGKPAKWIDYSNTVGGVTEGVAVMLPADAAPRKWLTREYGTFGPRRAEKYSGTKFTLKQGDHLSGRVILFVHRGDVNTARVAERYKEWMETSE